MEKKQGKIQGSRINQNIVILKLEFFPFSILKHYSQVRL